MIRITLFVTLLVIHQALTQFSKNIRVDRSALEAYRALSSRYEYNYILFKIDSGNTLVVDETGDPSKTYDDFLQRLEAIGASGDCRWAVYLLKAGVGRGFVVKVPFFLWCLPSVPMRIQMPYSGSVTTIKNEFHLSLIDFTPENIDEIKYETVVQQLFR